MNDEWNMHLSHECCTVMILDAWNEISMRLPLSRALQARICHFRATTCHQQPHLGSCRPEHWKAAGSRRAWRNGAKVVTVLFTKSIKAVQQALKASPKAVLSGLFCPLPALPCGKALPDREAKLGLAIQADRRILHIRLS